MHLKEARNQHGTDGVHPTLASTVVPRAAKQAAIVKYTNREKGSLLGTKQNGYGLADATRLKNRLSTAEVLCHPALNTPLLNTPSHSHDSAADLKMERPSGRRQKS